MSISDVKNHGLDWGWHKRVGDGWRVKHTSMGGDYERVNSLEECLDPNVHLVKLGNDFGPNWIKHTDIPHKNWCFWDNPLVPHFLYPNPANPKGAKDWIRWVPGDILSNFSNVEDGHEDRINRLLTQLAKKPTTWRDVVKTHAVVERNSRKIMLTPSSMNCYAYYYDDTRERWIHNTTKLLEERGWEVLVWNKPARNLRVKSEPARLYNRLLVGDIRATVSQHSAAAIESLCAGVPVITTGPDPAGEFGMEFDEFYDSGELITATRDELDAWLIKLLSHVRHKSEIFSGEWR